MNIFTKFYQNILQNAPNCTILKNFLRGMLPLANAWLRHALHGALRHANTPTFTKKFEPPPRNEILNTPLIAHNYMIYTGVCAIIQSS